jgi:hypothetical protein
MRKIVKFFVTLQRFVANAVASEKEKNRHAEPVAPHFRDHSPAVLICNIIFAKSFRNPPLYSGLNKVIFKEGMSMKISTTLGSAAALLIMSVVATVAFAGQQRVERIEVTPQGERYAYVLVTGSRIPQKVKISPIGTLTDSPLSVHDRREIDRTRAGTVQQALSNEPSLSFRGH